MLWLPQWTDYIKKATKTYFLLFSAHCDISMKFNTITWWQKTEKKVGWVEIHPNRKTNWLLVKRFVVNKTEWSPLRSVIIRVRKRSDFDTLFKLFYSTTIWVINKIRWQHDGSPTCLITSMITDRIGWNEVLSPKTQYNKICDVFAHLKIKNTRNSKRFLASSWKKATEVHARDGTYCPITLSY